MNQTCLECKSSFIPFGANKKRMTNLSLCSSCLGKLDELIIKKKVAEMFKIEDQKHKGGK